MSDWIVAVFLGDSLTAGFQQGPGYLPPRYYPFVNMIESSLRTKIKELSAEHDIACVNEGIDGDSTWGMLQRFKRSVESEKPNIVVIWGGINDLSSMKKPEEIHPNIIELVTRVKTLGAVPVVVNAAPVAGAHFNDKVRALNRITEAYCLENGVEYFDVFSLLVDSEGKLADIYSNDGVHLSIQGYQKLSVPLFDVLVKITEKILEAT